MTELCKCLRLDGDDVASNSSQQQEEKNRNLRKVRRIVNWRYFARKLQEVQKKGRTRQCNQQQLRLPLLPLPRHCVREMKMNWRKCAYIDIYIYIFYVCVSVWMNWIGGERVHEWMAVWWCCTVQRWDIRVQFCKSVTLENYTLHFSITFNGPK